MPANLRLTKKALDALQWQDGGASQQFFWDSGLPGFGAYVLSSGRKTFVVQFRARGKSRRITIGPYGVLTVEQARDKAREILATVALEGDWAPPKPVEAERTVADVAADFLEHARAVLKPTTSTSYRRTLVKHVLPRFGKRPLASITTGDLMKMHLAMQDRPYMANRAVEVVHSMWLYAASMGIVTKAANPCPDVKRYRESQRERFLTPEELKRLGAVLRTVTTDYRIDAGTVDIIRLLLLTGCRLGEVMKAKWEWLDLDRGFLNLPDPGAKTGKRSVILSPVALAIFDAQPRIAGNPHVFPGQKNGAPKSNIWDAWKQIRTAAGIEDVRIHDLRHSHASVGVSSGLSLPIVGKLLGHKKASSTARYAHLADDPVRAATTAVGDIILGSLDE